MTKRPRTSGFTLIELLIVIAVMLVLMGAAFLAFGRMFRGNALIKSHTVLSTQLMQARQYAANTRRTHFIYFDTVSQNAADPAAAFIIRVRIFIDTNTNAVYDAADQAVGAAVTLPPGLEWVRKPDWIGIVPTGEVRYPSTYTWVQRRQFEDTMANTVSGFPADTAADLVLKLKAEGYRMYFDLEESSARLRKPQMFTGS